MKKKYLLILLVIPIIIYIFIDKDNKVEKTKYPIEIISCNVNDKIYEYEVYYIDNYYTIKSNDYILSDITYTLESDLKNVIEGIFINKNGTCYTNIIEEIELDL